MKRDFGRWLRIGLASVLTLVIATALAPHAVSHFAASAVVTAPLSVIRTPIEGRLTEAPGAPGRPVRAGEALALVERTEGDDARLRAIVATQDALAGALASLDDQIVAATRRRDRFMADDAGVLTLHRRRLSAEVEEHEAEGRRLGAQRDLARADHALAAELVARGRAPEHRLLETGAGFAALQAGLEAAEARARQSRARLAAADRGFLLFDGGVDRTEAGRQRDYADLRLDDLTRERARVAAELDAARRSRTAERAAFSAQARFAPLSPVDGVLWSDPPAAGRPMLPGDVVVQVLECRARFVEALIDEGLAARISPGDRAVVRIKGIVAPVGASVTAVAGAGAGRDAERLAAAPAGDPGGRLRVSLTLDPGALPEDPARFCHVGLPAEVRFHRDAPLAWRLAGAALGAVAEHGGRALASLLTDAPVASLAELGPATPRGGAGPSPAGDAPSHGRPPR